MYTDMASICRQILFCCCFLLFESAAITQQIDKEIRERQHALLNFSNSKGSEYVFNKRKADSFAHAIRIPASYRDKNGQIVILQRLEKNNRPVYYSTDNLNAAGLISVDEVWFDEYNNPFLTGEGVNVHIWDGGAILMEHQEFLGENGSRIFMHNRNLTPANHSTHIAGTVAATGVNANAKGMAGQVSVYGWDFTYDIAEMAILASEGLLVSNHSYGPLCGWYYNAQIDSWYWYGDREISETEDYKFGYYSQVSADLDFIAWAAPNYLIVKSAGNDRQQQNSNPDFPHYVWNNDSELWEPVVMQRDADGGDDGYDCLTPMAVAKNILTVGAVDDEKQMTLFSAFGPTDDGRIKPDVVTKGTDVYSSTAEGVDSYGVYNGTSMAAASATGSIALLHHLQNICQPGVKILSSTIKGLLVHTAEDLGNEGPDYRFGWGLLNMKQACDLFVSNATNGGAGIHELELSEGQEITIPVELSSEIQTLKVTICWIDPAGQVGVPGLNTPDSKLVNDLNILVEDLTHSTRYFPWVLNPDSPSAMAYHGVNHVDNIEQICIPNPGRSRFNIKVSHSGSLFEGKQAFSIIITTDNSKEGILPAKDLRFNLHENNLFLQWSPPENASPVHYNIYKDEQLISEIADTFYFENALPFGQLHEYYVKAEYSADGDPVESIKTNTVYANPLESIHLPLVIDFEEDIPDITIKSNSTGWLLGNSETIGNYYLDFSENATSFIGIDSYSNDEISHTTDVAATRPLKFGAYENVSISFDYMLVSGLYESVDELHLVYKLYYEDYWKEWIDLPREFFWTHKSFSLPGDAYKNGIQIGFYYDDMYQWGLGAAVDNISITGTFVADTVIDIIPLKITEPVTQCELTHQEKVSLVLKNGGENILEEGMNIELSLDFNRLQTYHYTVVMDRAVHPDSTFRYTFPETFNFSKDTLYSIDVAAWSGYNDPLNDTLYWTIENLENPNPIISDLQPYYCLTNDTFLLEGLPPDGTFSGQGVADSLLILSSLYPGDIVVSYESTLENNCSGDTSYLVTLIELPDVRILTGDSALCADADSLVIVFYPEGGILTGEGVKDNVFYPKLTSNYLNQIVYTYTDQHGCKNADTTEISLLSDPEPYILNDATDYCSNDDPVLVMAEPSGGIFEGPGIIGNYIYPSKMGEGSYSVSYTYTADNGCSDEAFYPFSVLSAPYLSLDNDTTIFIESSLLLQPVTNANTFLWSDGSADPYMMFFATENSLGVNLIYLDAWNESGCYSSDSIFIRVERQNSSSDTKNAENLTTLFPNPARNEIRLISPENHLVKKVDVFDITGKYIQELRINEEGVYAIDFLKPGLFLLRIKVDEVIEYLKFIKL